LVFVFSKGGFEASYLKASFVWANLTQFVLLGSVDKMRLGVPKEPDNETRVAAAETLKDITRR